MKKILLSISILLVSTIGYTQNSVGIGTTTPNTKSILDLNSTNQGFLPPRVTDAQMTAIGAGVADDNGMLVFNTTQGEFYYFDFPGGAWKPIAGASSNDWSILGNAGTTNGTNFIGTTDAVDLDVRTNNMIKHRFTQQGQIEFLNTGSSVFIGNVAGFSDDLTANENVFIGEWSGAINNTGSQNNFIGAYAGQSNSGGSSNNFIGARAGGGNTTGNNNDFIGYNAGNSNSTGNNNVYMGLQSGLTNNGSDNLMLGFFAGVNDIATSYNVYLGSGAGMIGNSGNYNSFTGYYAGGSSTGDNNTFAGAYSGYNNTGYENVNIGLNSGYTNTGGYRNVNIGSGAARYGSGYRASVHIGYNSGLYDNATGNVIIGGNAADDNVNYGSSNTIIGQSAEMFPNITNATAIGANTVVDSSNTVKLGNNANVQFDGDLRPNGQPGISGQVLTSQGAGVAPTWGAIASGADTDWTESGNYVFNTTDSIGIGINSPQAPLHVRKYNDVQMILGHSNQSSHEWMFQVDALGDMLISNENAGTPNPLLFLYDNGAGSYGVTVGGTAAPTEKLDIYDGSLVMSGNVSATERSFKMRRSDTPPSNISIDIASFWYKSNSYSDISTESWHFQGDGYRFYDHDATNEWMTIRQGNVGIGTGGASTPAERLTVSGNVLAQWFRGDVLNDKGTGQPLRLYANGPVVFGSDNNNDGTGGFTWYNNGESAANIDMVLDDLGYLGIGTTAPAAPLDVRHTAGMRVGGTTTKYIELRTNGTGNDINSEGGTLHIEFDSDQDLNVGNGDFVVHTASNQASVGNYATGSYGNFATNGAGGTQGNIVINRTDGDGTLMRFRSSGATQGTITMAAGVVSYNAFTGSHYAWSDGKIERGMLVSLTGVNKSLEDNLNAEILYGITKTQLANDSKVIGSYSSLQDPNIEHSTSNPHLVMAVGNGDLWVVDNGGNLEPGDYLISSSTSGHAMLDNGSYEIAYVLARVAEPVDWANETKMIDGKKHKKISVSFENMIINHKAEKLELELKELSEKYDNVKADVDFIKNSLNLDAESRK